MCHRAEADGAGHLPGECGEPLPRFTEAQAEEGGTAGHGQVCLGSRELSRVTVVGHWEAVLGKMARVYARKN